nr:integrase, catalytic region, zinc finger, CCHC-type, peptidase aspartic, catalytic [Tanacetum cinerariifolium]
MYGRGKENGVNILKSIDEGPFQMGTFRETLAEGNESALHLGPEQPRVYYDISLKEKERFVTAVKLNRGLRDSNYDQLYAYPLRGQGNNARGAGAAGYGGARNRVGNANSCQARQSGQDNVVDEDVDEQPVQDLALNVDNVFQADDCDVFDSDVDEAPNAQTMFMANLSSADLVYDEAGLFYDSDILSESMVEEVTSLKKDFKQKENKHLEEFLDMKALKEKAEDKLYKQDQSLQTVHMLCNSKPYYDE